MKKRSKKLQSVFLSTVIMICGGVFCASAAEVKNIPVLVRHAAANAPSTAAKTSAPNPVQIANAPAKTPVQPPVVNAPAPTLAPAEVYNYNPMGKPDPFRPFIVIEQVEKKKTEKKAPPSIFPLQREETERYRVVGIAGDKDNMVAIAEDAAKKFYPLFKGTRIGVNGGKVVEIMADRVIVEEYENKKAKRIILKLRTN